MSLNQSCPHPTCFFCSHLQLQKCRYLAFALLQARLHFPNLHATEFHVKRGDACAGFKIGAEAAEVNRS